MYQFLSFGCFIFIVLVLIDGDFLWSDPSLSKKKKSSEESGVLQTILLGILIAPFAAAGSVIFLLWRLLKLITPALEELFAECASSLRWLFERLKIAATKAWTMSRGMGRSCRKAVRMFRIGRSVAAMTRDILVSIRRMFRLIHASFLRLWRGLWTALGKALRAVLIMIRWFVSWLVRLGMALWRFAWRSIIRLLGLLRMNSGERRERGNEERETRDLSSRLATVARTAKRYQRARERNEQAKGQRWRMFRPQWRDILFPSMKQDGEEGQDSPEEHVRQSSLSHGRVVSRSRTAFGRFAGWRSRRVTEMVQGEDKNTQEEWEPASSEILEHMRQIGWKTRRNIRSV